MILAALLALVAQEAPAEAIRSRIAACGIDPERVAVAYDDLVQDYSAAIAGDPPGARAIECLAEDGLRNGPILFGDAALQTRYFEAYDKAVYPHELRRARDWLMRRGLLAKLPTYDPAHDTVAGFAQKLETLCGFAPGSALALAGPGSLTIRPEPLADIDYRIDCLFAAVTASDLKAHGIGLGFVGNEAPGR